MKILVTGGSGFLGGRLIPRLAGMGHEVFALARSASSHQRLRALGASPVTGDLEEGTPLSHRAPYFRTNVDGTAALLAAAQKAGATTFVYVSAAGIIMDDRGSSIRNAD